MKSRIPFLLLFLVSCSSVSNKSDLRFSNTMKWNQDFWNMSTHPYAHLDETDVFELPEPPSNNSDETRKELEHLLALQSIRTPENEAEIASQLKLGDYKYDCFQIKDLDNKKLTYLPQILSAFSLDVIAVMMRQKRKYDRVRPTYLEKKLAPSIAMPEHPAYPSGHSTENHVFAHLFSELNPEKKDLYFKTAKKIAENRELAGVHYPSDTKAGIILGGQIFTAYMKKEKFRALVKNASVEFNKNFSCK